ncbi:hypothetical protein TCAL_14331 [Tigriopus californicus]|uniref:C2H2-type domain-containing protein n=1 Tax=Tigriopus californicus TaxID=6832 RepID=A0A553NFL4_TIGCA|nr:zinc finger protein 62 homolog [Tigriopus californicus]TRY64243.1 hypothetical protein TCAL_14331 [Tigriopus californicus]
MEFRAQILKKLTSLPQSLNILHNVIDNWILFQRNTFDHLDDTGDPYISQIFLIEISSGRYIHRSQGQKVDQGKTLDLDVLTSKLTHVFLGTKPCPGFPVQHHMEQSDSVMILDYPYPRQASRECQFYFNAHIKSESGHDATEDSASCSPCQEAWQDINSKGACMIEADPLQDSTTIKLHPTPPMAEEDNPSLMDFDYEVLNTTPGDLWSDENAVLTSSKRSSNQDLEPLIESKLEVLSDQETRGKGRVYKCKCCSHDFRTSAELARHRRARKMKKRAQRKVGCLECDNKNIVTFRQLVDHVAKDHPDKLEEYAEYLPKNQDPALMKDPLKCIICDFMNNGSVLNFKHRELYHEMGSYVCGKCQEPNRTYYDLMIHNYQKHRMPTDFLPPSLYGLKRITLSGGKIQYKKTPMSKCHLCPKMYKNDHGLINHMRGQHQWGMFNCNPCEESCHFARDFSTHALQFHGDNPEIKCPNCLQEFDLKADPELFNVHYQTCFLLIHTEGNQNLSLKQLSQNRGVFQCDICGRNFNVKRNLEIHMDAHQGIFRFLCSFCDFGSNQKSTMEDHELMHVTNQALADGKIKDVLHQCEQCGKQLRSAKLLKRHLRIVHEGKKPTFRCKDCGEFFKHFVALYKHKKYSHGFVSKSKHI